MQATPLHHRVSKVCARCRKRKTKCDFRFPSCSTCKAAGTACNGYNSSLGKEVPRSIVRSLEDEVIRLQNQLLVQKAQYPPQKASLPAGARLIRTIYTTTIPKSQSFFSSTIFESFFHQPSCPPLALHREEKSPFLLDVPFKTLPPPTEPALHTEPMFDLKTVPLEAITAMVQNYTTFHLHQYPILTQSWVRDLVSSVLAMVEQDRRTNIILTCYQISHFEYFCFFIVLAISSLTLIWRHEDHARSSSQRFSISAMKHLRLIADISEIEKLQISLLLAHYAHMNPGVADTWTCVANTTKLVLDLALHKKSPDSFSSEQKEVRARLFWVTYGMDRMLCNMLRLPLSFPEESITVDMPVDDILLSPDMLNDAEVRRRASANHLYLYRSLETEVHRVLHLCHDTEHLQETGIIQWIRDINTRLDLWYEKSQNFSDHGVLEFRHVQYNYLKTKIHRPTPRLSERNMIDRQICVDSCQRIIDSVHDIAEFRILFYPWQGAHILFGAAVILLDVYCRAAPSETVKGRVEHVLSVTIPVCLNLLENIGKIWRAAKDCADHLRPVLEEVSIYHGLQGSSAIKEQVLKQETTMKIHRLLFADVAHIRIDCGSRSDVSALDETVQTMTDGSPILMEDLQWDPDWSLAGHS